MIQRVQTIYLLLVVLISGLLFLLPAFDLLPASPADAVATGFLITNNSFLLILNCAIGCIAFVTIFLYKKRKTQIKACNLEMILICVLVGLLFYTADTLSGVNKQVHYKVGTYLPLLQLVFTFLAMRGIKKDDELVRSADRLR